MQKVKFEDLILFENDDYIVVNKPPFISTLTDRNDKTNILTLAKAYADDAQVCHRLDKETSGALVIAKNPEAYRSLSMQFEKRTVEKKYHAISDGIHSFKNEMVNKALQVSGSGQVRTNSREGKESVTHFTTLKAYKYHTLIECTPLTGRMHQIRVHLTTLGAPITGDSLYGGKPFMLSHVKKKYNLKKWEDEKPLVRRFALHASSITFALLNGEVLTIEAGYPKDFKVLVRQLEKNC